MKRIIVICVIVICGFVMAGEQVTLNQKTDGYRGIWYSCQPTSDEYVYKYSGGLGTYCAKHRPFAVYAKEVNKTFFVYGGSAEDDNKKLLHMVSYFDHKTKKATRPTILLDKKTDDAHDNPVISIDEQGYIWIFSTSHGRGRPSYIHKSKKPFDIDEFKIVKASYIDENGSKKQLNNFSYFQIWNTEPKKFISFFTRYSYPTARTICFMTSDDGKKWSKIQKLSTMANGSYQISAVNGNKAATFFNIHPGKETPYNNRTNLYYIQTADFGKTWQSVDGRKINLPLTNDDISSSALVHDYRSEKLLVYLKDMVFDKKNNPVLLYVTSKGWQCGPENDPREWTIAHWVGDKWKINTITASDNNYDSGSLYIESDGRWKLIAPTEKGPQQYNPGGEVAIWISKDEGDSWVKQKQVTNESIYNHSYVRRPINAHDDFYAFWADGHARKESNSSLYYCDKAGNVSKLPAEISD